MFQTLGEGDMVGLSWLIPPYRWTLRCARRSSSSARSAIDGDCLREKCEADHDLGYEHDEAVRAGPGRSGCRRPGCRCSTSTARAAELSTRVAAAADPMLPRVVSRVARVRREVPDTWTLDDRAADGAGVRLRARPVQHALRLRRRRGADLDQRRPGRAPDVLVHTMRAVGAVADALTPAQARRPSACADRTASAGRSRRRSARDVVIIAGGLGLAPLRPAIYRLLAERARIGRIVLLFGSAQPDDILFQRELERWRGGSTSTSR